MQNTDNVEVGTYTYDGLRDLAKNAAYCNEECAAGERARVCSRPDGKAGLDCGHQSSPVQSSPGFPNGRV